MKGETMTDCNDKNKPENQRLVAAAPDLFRACQEAVSAMQLGEPYLRNGFIDRAGWQEVIENIQTAIDKAEHGE